VSQLMTAGGREFQGQAR